MQDVLSWLENHESQEQLHFVSGVFCSILGHQHMFISTTFLIFYKKNHHWNSFISWYVCTHLFLYDSTVWCGITVKLEWKFFLHETQGLGWHTLTSSSHWYVKNPHIFRVQKSLFLFFKTKHFELDLSTLSSPPICSRFCSFLKAIPQFFLT